MSSTRTTAQSPRAASALQLVTTLQQRFVRGLEALADTQNSPQSFQPVEWLRDEGVHGGGIRYETADGALIGRGSVNVSQVHYDDMAEKKLGSATAISTIIHPLNPLAASVHIHISWTEMKSGSGYWRIMADLNPANENPAQRQQFLDALQAAAPAQFAEATAQGDRYFYIPALQRHRGVAHFYLEQFHSDDPQADFTLAEQVGQSAIDTYIDLFRQTLVADQPITEAARTAQLAYHTLYFFQVLTLDRGTTTGLLVHDQNDIGIMGSLPARIDRDLLQSWLAQMQPPQDQLLQALIDTLPAASPVTIDEPIKAKLAATVRRHYADHPEAIQMQASGHVTPNTVENHSTPC